MHITNFSAESYKHRIQAQARIYIGLDYLKIRVLLTFVWFIWEFVRNKIQPQSKENKLLQFTK